jgi:type I restriction enzyme, R subunit
LTPALGSEYQLEQATLKHFKALGWDTILAEIEQDGDTNILGRNEHTEVVLTRYLLPFLKARYSNIPESALLEAIITLSRDRSHMQNIPKANEDVYRLLKDGIPVTYNDATSKKVTERVWYIDWDNPGANHFLVVSQMWVAGAMYKKRPDLIGFVNGIPLLTIELKADDVHVKHAFSDNLTDYKDTIPQLFWYNAFLMISNGSQSKIGSTTSAWEHFADWKKIDDEAEAGVISLDTMLKGTCEKSRFLDIVENFIIYQEDQGGLRKLVAKNHQYLGVNNAIDAVHNLKSNAGRLGVFWHTQGSGKSASMIFFSQKVLRKLPGNWTFVLITDRKELDNQIYRTFQDSRVVSEDRVQAESIKDLRKLLSEDHRFVFTLIHKFGTENGAKHPVLSERDDIIIITDEAHRSQYDTLAQNMRDALPNAAFLGFTGTPLIQGEEQKTREVFGEYVSVYDFKQSIEDGATVPLYYQNRLPEVQLKDDVNLNDELNRILEESMLDDEQEKKLEHNFSRMYQIVTRDERLDKVAVDIVTHFLGRADRGKAMVIAIDKATAIKLYDRVQTEWKQQITQCEHDIASIGHLDEHDAAYPSSKLAVLQDRLEYLQETDMAVVISSAQNEVADMQKKGIDIAPHRERMNAEELDEKFKKADDPFRIVFVCAMWMTGFDVPSCNTIYLDKPMRNHTLMQTIARANRVYADKTSGQIIDYVGVFRNLEKALAVYGVGGTTSDPPIKDKQELLKLLNVAIEDMQAFLEPLGVDLEEIRVETDIFKRIALKDDAVDKILVTDDTRRDYLHRADYIRKVYKAYLPDQIAAEIGETAYVIRKIAKKIRALVEPVDVSHILAKVENMLDESVEGFEIREPEKGYQTYDLGQIDFEALKEKFEKGRKRTEIQRLNGLISTRLADMIAKNRTRLDWQNRYEELLKEYNQYQVDLTDFFNKLVKFGQDLEDEEKRYIREELDNEEELSIFDLLTKPAPKLTKAEVKQVKSVSRDIYNKFHAEKIAFEWRKKQQGRATMRVEIEKMLDKLPVSYEKQIYEEKCSSIYEYVYQHPESY